MGDKPPAESPAKAKLRVAHHPNGTYLIYGQDQEQI